MAFAPKLSIDKERLGEELMRLGNHVKDAVAANQADSTAAMLGDLVTDFNALLDKLKEAGLMEPDVED